MTERAAGWLADPFDPQGSVRYWDGSRWTSDTRPATEPTAPSVAPPLEPPEPEPEANLDPESDSKRWVVIAAVVAVIVAGLGWFALGGDDAEIATTDSSTSSTLAISTTTAAATTTSTTTTSTTTSTTTTTTIPLIVVPDATGLSAAAAQTMLESAGLMVTTVEVEDAGVEPGTVISTEPGTGTELNAGDSVEVRIAVTPPPECNDVSDPVPAAGFGDTSGLSDEGTAAANWAAAVGLVSDGAELKPRDPMSRAALTTVLWRYFCEPPPTSSAGYPDVDVGAFYATAADWAAEEGYVTGTADGTFNPDAPITRAQFVTIAWRSVGEPVPAGPAPFTDAVAGSFYSSALDWAFSEGLVGGTSANTFDPDGPLDRITSVILFYRLELNVDPEVMQ